MLQNLSTAADVIGALRVKLLQPFHVNFTNLTFLVNQDITVTQFAICLNWPNKVRKMAKIRKRYNQAPHLTQDTTWERNKTKNQ